MKRFSGTRDGFAFYELMVVLVLTTILGGLVYVNLASTERAAREATLKSRVAEIRIAIDRYYQDHGFYPRCNDGRDSDPAIFERQLEWHSDAEGRVSRKKTPEFCYGPYLDDLPVETVTGSAHIVVDTTNQRALPSLAEAVSGGPGEGGWYYEVKSGNVVANLGREFDSKYAHY